MKALVTVKEVREVPDEFEIADRSVDERFLEYGLNEWDDYAIEAAVRAREAGIVDEVVTATVGPERTEETIRMALAKGADRAIRVWDEPLESAELLDVRATTRVLAEIVEREDPDVVFTGVQASDDGFAAMGVSLAEFVGYGWAAVVNDVDIDADGGVAHVHRELEGGLEELVDVSLPAVLTIQTGLNEPRYASLRGIRQAQSKELARHDLADLELDGGVVGNDLRLAELYEPESEGDAAYFDGEPGEQADALAELLREKGVVEA